MKIITRNDLLEASCFNVGEAVEIIEQAFLSKANGEVYFPDKTSVVFNKSEQTRINCLPGGIVADEVYGTKWVSVFPNNPSRFSLPNLNALILLSELRTGLPIALMEGTLCSNLRTASVNAIAAKYLAKKESNIISFIGAGEQAKAILMTMKSVMPSISVCKVSSRTSASVHKFISQMSRFYPEMKFEGCGDNYKKATENADIIVTAISGQEDILKSSWIAPGTLYCHVAGYEDEYDVALKADKIVCDDWESVKHRTQTISRMYKEGLLKDKDIYGNLDDLVSGKLLGRESNEEFIYFNSVGCSFADIALAYHMYKKVKNVNLGADIEMGDESMYDSPLSRVCL